MKYLIAIFILGLPAFAQDGQLSLGGTVGNSKTGEPVRRAMVTLSRISGDVSSALKPVVRTAFTDSGGSFRFTGLPTGEYSIVAEKPEFTADSAPGQPFLTPFDLSASTENVNLKLSPLGVITGAISDQDGLPLPYVSVMALSAQIQDGLRQVKSDRTVTTDDRGVYRFWNLTPGRYYVKAAGLAGGASEYVGDTLPLVGDENFASVYFGGAHTFDSAVPVVIEPGSEVRADFAVTVERAYRITGTAEGFVSRRAVRFELLNGADDVSATRVSINSDTGKFVAGPVVPGSYLLRATQDDSSAEVPLTVMSADLDGVAVTLAPPVEIPVVTQFTNAPDTADSGPMRFAASLCNPILRRVGTPGVLRNPFPKRPAQPGGAVVIAGVSPGRYSVSVQCFGAYPRSATSGAQDLGVNPMLTVLPGVTPAPIQIVATYGGGSIAGKLMPDGASALDQASVLLIPQFPSPAGPQLAPAFRSPDDPARLRFQFAALAPGSYTAWAFATRDIEFRNPEFLRTLSAGVVVQIDGNDPKELSIDGVVH